MDHQAYVEMDEAEGEHWWFTARREIVGHMIRRLSLPAHASILEIGSGTGGNLHMLSSFGEVSAMEMNTTAIAMAVRKHGDRFDIRAGSCPGNIPFDTERFDLICLFDVLEHIEEDVATLVAIRRLLADGGKVFLTVPAYPWMWSGHDAFVHHKRRYSLQELRSKVVAAGFHVRRLSFFNTLLFPLVAGARLVGKLLGRDVVSGTAVPSAPVNRLLNMVFRFERHLLGRHDLPFGVSLLAVLELKGEREG